MSSVNRLRHSSWPPLPPTLPRVYYQFIRVRYSRAFAARLFLRSRIVEHIREMGEGAHILAPYRPRSTGLTYHRVRSYLLGGGRRGRRPVRQDIAQRQGRRDDLPFLLEVEIVQAIAALRRRHDRHRLRRRVMMVVVLLVVQITLYGQIAGLVVAAVVGARTGHQVDAAHAYRHGARGPFLEATPSPSAPRP